MIWFILCAGCFIITICLAILVAPKFLRAIYNFFSLGSRIYLTSFIRLVLGVMLLVLAPRARLWGFVVTIGIIVAAAGLSFFFFGLRRTKKLLTRLKTQSNLVLRLYAMIALVTWALLIYALLPAIPLVQLD